MDIVFLILIGLLLIGFSVFGVLILMTRVITGVPYVPTSKKVVSAMVNIATIKPNDSLYDLGSGNGAILFHAPKNTKRIGYEKMKLLHLWARLRNWIKQDTITFTNKDFYTVNLSNADVIFCYLFPSLMERFEKEIWPKLNTGCQVVSHGFRLPTIKETKHTKIGNANIFLYIKK